MVNLLYELIDGIQNVWTDTNIETTVLLSVYFAVIVGSSILVFFMVKYKGKTALDIAFIAREIAFLLIIWRVFIFRYTGASNIYYIIFTLLFITLAYVGILFFLVRDRYLSSDKQEQELHPKDITYLE